MDRISSRARRAEPLKARDQIRRELDEMEEDFSLTLNELAAEMERDEEYYQDFQDTRGYLKESSYDDESYYDDWGYDDWAEQIFPST